MGQHQNDNYLGGDSSQEAFISLPLTRAISPGIIAFGLAFVGAFITACIATPIKNSDALQQVSATLDDSGYYINVSTDSTVDLSLITTPDGASTIGKDTVTTETNSKTGFKLYISSSSATANTNRLYKDGDSTSSSYLSPLSSVGQLEMNSWGYAVANLNGNGDTITVSSRFTGLPLLNSEELIQSYTEAAPTGSGATVDVYYGVKANTALPAGTYTGTVKYTVLAEGSPANDGEVSVSPSSSAMTGGETLTIATGLYTNAADLGTITVAVGDSTCSNVQTSTSSSGSINLICTLPAFATSAGWKTVTVNFAKFSKTYTIAEGVWYYPTTLAELNSLSLSERYMQFMTSDICGEMTVATKSNYASVQLQLTDSRDSNAYLVRRLADGNCWMTENLRLTFSDGYAVGVDDGSLTTLTSHNSDFTTLSSWTGGGTTETSTTATIWYTDGDNSNLNDLAKSYTFKKVKDTKGDDSSQYKGVLYNWLVATAGVGTSSVSGSTNDSICPYGWRLPINGDGSIDKSWAKLLANADSSSGATWNAAVRAVPYSLIRAGIYDGAAGTVLDVSGNFWSATASADTKAYYLAIISTSNVNPQYSSVKGTGRSIRCVNR